MIKVVITGVGGQVGQELRRADWPPGTSLTVFGHDDLDIADDSEVRKKIVPPLDAVINAAAYTAVDRAESERAGATAVNTEGPALLARHCAALGVPLIHFSTDYVFNGARQTPYVEDDATTPLNHYGVSKLMGEAAVREGWREHIIIRTASVFSEFGNNFVKSMMRLGTTRESLGVVSDQWSCPTPAQDIAAATVRIVECVAGRVRSEFWGTYHFCGQPPVTWFGFAKEIFELCRAHGMSMAQLHEIGAADYPGAAHRPPYSAMDCSKICRTFGITAPSWARRLDEVVTAILKRNAE